MNSVLLAHEAGFWLDLARPEIYYDQDTPAIESPDTLFGSMFISPCSYLLPPNNKHILFLGLNSGKDD